MRSLVVLMVLFGALPATNAFADGPHERYREWLEDQRERAEEARERWEERQEEERERREDWLEDERERQEKWFKEQRKWRGDYRPPLYSPPRPAPYFGYGYPSYSPPRSRHFSFYFRW